MARLCIHLLGPFHVTLADKPVTGFESNKVRALLAFLSLEAARPHTRDALIGLLWPDQPQRPARRNLSQALFNLRQTIGDDVSACFLQITRETVQFNSASDYWLDARAFAEHLAVVQMHPHAGPAACESCIQHLDQAVELYAGEFLAGLFVGDSATFSEWATLLRERLHRQVLDALYQLTGHHERRRDYARARHYAQRQVELEPWREEAHQQLMRLLVHSGQRSAALQQYEICRRNLADELGIEPSSETQRLYRRIRSALTGTLRAHNLPPQVTPFVGREKELRDLACRLADPACRLLTLVGPGGIGKTRLAIQVAHENRSSFLHGICFVSLASLQSAELLASTLAGALGLYPDGQTDPKLQVIEALHDQELLVVLDNFEHLIEDGAYFLADILQGAPEVTLLVTSRERLNLRAETVFDVGGLEFPSETQIEQVAAYSAVALFLQSADRAQAGFKPAHGGMADVVRICRLVEGMPLGVELAAVWVRVLPCREIAEQIERGLAFLSASARDVPPRHRSMQAAFDHSWERLQAEERSAFRKLAVFRGGFDRGAALPVAGASLATLAALVDKSFLKEMVGRYSLHELMRQYAAEKLAQDAQDAQQAHDAHCHFYVCLVDGAFARFKAGQQRAALDTMKIELDNVRAALQWAVDHRWYQDLERLMAGLYVFCDCQNFFREGYLLWERATAALEQAIGEQTGKGKEIGHLLGKLLWRQAELAREFDTVEERPRTLALAQRSVSLLRSCDDPAELADALGVLGNVLRKHGQATQARPILEESVALARQSSNPLCLAGALHNLGQTLGAFDRNKSVQLFHESLSIHREHSYLPGLAHNLNNLGASAYFAGDYVSARQWFLESQAAFEELGDPGRVAMTMNNLGEVCRLMGEYAACAHYLGEVLRRCHAAGSGRLHSNVLTGLAQLAKAQAQYQRAYELAAFVHRWPMTEQSVYEEASALLIELASHLSPEEAAAAKAHVETWTLDDAVAEALAIQ